MNCRRVPSGTSCSPAPGVPPCASGATHTHTKRGTPMVASPIPLPVSIYDYSAEESDAQYITDANGDLFIGSMPTAALSMMLPP